MSCCFCKSAFWASYHSSFAVLALFGGARCLTIRVLWVQEAFAVFLLKSEFELLFSPCVASSFIFEIFFGLSTCVDFTCFQILKYSITFIILAVRIVVMLAVTKLFGIRDLSAQQRQIGFSVPPCCPHPSTSSPEHRSPSWESFDHHPPR